MFCPLSRFEIEMNHSFRQMTTGMQFKPTIPGQQTIVQRIQSRLILTEILHNSYNNSELKSFQKFFFFFFEITGPFALRE